MKLNIRIAISASGLYTINAVVAIRLKKNINLLGRSYIARSTCDRGTRSIPWGKISAGDFKNLKNGPSDELIIILLSSQRLQNVQCF